MPFEVMNTTAQTIPFSQNWSDASLLTNDNNWTLVPGIEGFTGNGLTFGTGADPQTLLTTGFLPSPQVFANQASPNTLTTGGVAEFDGIADPTIALQPNGAGNANAPYIIITLNSINRQNITVAYNLRDIDGSTDNAVQPVALQYRIGNSGNFINIPAGFVADATSGPGLATLVTPVSAALPVGANNQSVVQVRIITADAVGNDEWVGIDDVSISGTIINPVPVITTTPGTTTFIYNTPVVIDNGITVSDANNTTLASASISLSTGFQPATDILLFTADAATMGNINGSYIPGTLSLSSALNSATLAQWQAALKSIRFSSSSVPTNHSVTINFTVNDGTTNSIAATRQVAVYPSPPPIVTCSVGNSSYNFNTPVIIDNAITLTDANNATLSSAVVNLTGLFQAGNDILSFTNNGVSMGNISGNYFTPGGTLNLTSIGATATLAEWQSALRSITYTASVNPQVYNRTVSFVVNDGTNNSTAATKTIVIVAGLPPSVTSSAGSTTYIHSTPVIIDNAISVSDPENATLLSASINFGNSFEQGNDYLAFTNNISTMGNITGSYLSPLGILNLSSAGATATLAQWQAALRSITYYNIGNPPLTYSRTITFTVNDGNANSNPAQKTINFMPLGSIGQSWSAAIQVLDPNTGTGGNAGGHSKMIMVNGNPAIVCLDNTRNNLVYRRATDASGISFGPAITLDSLGNVGWNLSVQIVNGNPAVSYYDVTNKDLKFIRALDANGTSWANSLSIDVVGDVGFYTSLQVVNGNPAIAYYDNVNLDLKYVRATNASGSAWGSPITLDATGDQGEYACLQIVNGNPAIAYHDFTNRDLKYIRALDVSGNSWGSALSIDVTGNVGQYTSLQIINGNPAVSYYDATNTDLKYIRSTDASGTSWAAAITTDATAASVGSYNSLQTVNGNPAISYFDGTSLDLKYVRASDVSGSAWALPISIDVTGSVGSYTSLQVVNGNPAISYADITNGNLKFLRATDISGATWGLALSFDCLGDVGSFTSLQLVGGNPAFAYYNVTTNDLQFIRANNTTGTTWGTPLTIDAANVGETISMQIVNGLPSIAYYDRINGNLKYVSANDPTGSTWGTPVNVDVTGDVGYQGSLFIVNGNPAISYYDRTNGNLKYVRANDVSGNSWGTPVNLDITGTVGEFSILRVVSGNPAIAYYDRTNADLKFIRANDVTGTTWAAPITLDASGNVGLTPFIKIINGNPAIAYYDGTNGDLKFIRANDNSGSIWGTALSIDITGNVGAYPSLQIINNLPSIAYKDVGSGYVKFISSSNISGTVWNTSVIVDGAGNTGDDISMIVSGNSISICYYSPGQALPFYLPGFYGFTSLPGHYYRSKQNGNWNDPDSWESSPDNINWGSATLSPDFNASLITIRNGHTISVTANVTVDQLVLQPGSFLITQTGNNMIIY